MIKKHINRLLVALITSIMASHSAMFSQEQHPDPSQIVRPSSVIVTIEEDGDFYVAGVKVAQDDIPLRVMTLLKNTRPSEQVVYIKPHRVVKYGTVVAIIDAIRGAGFNEIGLLHYRGKGAPQPSTLEARALAENCGRILRPQRPLNPLIVNIKSCVSPNQKDKSNSELIPLKALTIKLRETLRRRSDKTVYVRMPKDIDYGDTEGVIGVIKDAGAHSIRLQIDDLQ